MLAPAALALVLAAPGCELPALAAVRPFAPGETLSYEVGFAGAEGAGQATLAICLTHAWAWLRFDHGRDPLPLRVVRGGAA